MPLYEYRCEKCGKTFSLIQHVDERKKGGAKCPSCGSKHSEPQISRVFVETSRKS